MEYNTQNVDKEVPLSKIICEHSCQTNKAYRTDIGIIFQCQNMCETMDTKNPDDPTPTPVKPDENK